jgi:hypothetical protein
MIARNLSRTLVVLLALLLASVAVQAQTRNINHGLDGSNVITASSQASGFPAIAAFDGDRSGYGWGAGGGWNDNTRGVFPDTLSVAYARKMSLSRMVVVGLQDSFNSPVEPTPTQTCTLYGLKDFDIQVFDGVNWVTVSSITNNTLCVREVTFTPIRGSAARVVVYASWDGLYSRIPEFEQYSL